MRFKLSRRTLLHQSWLLALSTSPMGCQTARPDTTPDWEMRLLRPTPRLILRALASQIDDTEHWVRTALTPAINALVQHGLELRRNSEIRLHATVRSFVLDTGQSEPWLRAWTTFTTVHLLTPTLWRHQSLQAKQQRLTHELCHLAIYQAFPSSKKARAAKIPFWYLEGVCSVVANQGHSRMPLKQVIARSHGENPFKKLALASRDHLLTYGAAHHAAAFLQAQFGANVFRQILSDAVNGSTFPESLKKQTSLTLNELWNRLSSDRSLTL